MADAGTGGVVAGAVPAAVAATQGEQIGDMLSNYVPKGDEGGKAGEVAVDAEGAEAAAAKEAADADAAAKAAEAGGAAAPKGVEGAGEKDAVISSLQQQLAALTTKLDQLAAGKPPETKVEAAKPAEFKGQFFESAEEYNKAFEDQTTMNKVLSKVAQATAQTILSNLPQVVNNLVKSQVEVQSHVKGFFDTNKDLAAHRQFVGFVSNDLMGKNPGWTMDKLFGELGKEVRTRIGMKQAVDKGGKRLPAGGEGGFTPAKGGGARQPAAKSEALEGLQKEINDLII